MKYDKIFINIRFKSEIIERYYTDIFRTKSFGGERAAEIYPILREYALDLTKGVFSFEEIELLFKILGPLIDRFEISKEVFIQKIRDSIRIQPSLTVEQKEVIDQIINKIEKLSFFQVVILSEWISSYYSYSEEKYSKKKVSLKKYAARLLE